jgi:tetratricopeptide (TPR) repeat protein
MLLLASAYERNGMMDLADKQFADAMKISDFNPTVGLDYVAFLQRRNGTDRAYDVLTELANRWPNNVQILSALAQAKLSRQDWAGAQEIAETIKRVGNTGGDVADQILGAALSGQGKYDASIAAFQSAAAATPSAVTPGMVDLVKTMVNAKQTDKAIAYLQSVLKDNPKNAEAYVLLGNIQLVNKSLDQAEKSFRSAIDSQPKNSNGYQALANFYMSQKNTDAALVAIQTGLKEQPESPNLHLALAAILESKLDYEGAISEYESLLRQQPGSLVVINNLASLLADHRTDKASLDRAQSLALILRDSQVAQFKDTLGWIYNREGNFKASVPLLEEAATALPDSALIHYHLGLTYTATGQMTKASDQFKQALAKSPDSELEVKIRSELKKIGAQ